MPEVHAEFRTQVVVGELMVVGVLPGTPWRPVGSMEIRGPVDRVRDRACELAAALLLVGDRLDAVSDERYGALSPPSGRAG